MGSFFTQISDPAIGGTYMTLLNTVSNLGGTWPKYFVLLAVDYFTDAPCIGKDLGLSTGIKCSDEKSRTLCKTLGGTCEYISDGYYIVNTACFVFGIVSLIFYIKPTIDKLQILKNSAWRVTQKKVNKTE
jgi:MFS transporter, PAT family, solute carrier family 33 (acetyl-CoA transportor), member 1